MAAFVRRRAELLALPLLLQFERLLFLPST
jgi:hypothetical protein